MQRRQATSLCLVAGLVLLSSFFRGSDGLPPTICNENKLSLSPYAQKICDALTNISEFSRAMEEYLDAKLLRQAAAAAPANEQAEVKRQDLDHVFLRFGRSHK